MGKTNAARAACTKAARGLSVLGAVMSLASCTSGQEMPSDLDMSLYAAVSAIDGTYFYPPLGPGGVVPTGPFDPSLLGRLKVVLESTAATTGELRTEAIFDRRSVPPLALLGPRELYFVNAPAAAYFTDPTRAYRFRVLLDDTREIARSDMTDHIFEVLRWVPNVPVGVKVRIETRQVAAITSIVPDRVPRNSGAVTLTVSGTRLSSDSFVRFGGHDYATRRDALGRLLIDLPEAVTGVPGAYPITLFTPAPGGGESPAVTFSVYDPPAVVRAVSPASATANDPSLMITVSGDYFTDASRVYFDSTGLLTTFTSEHELTAVIPSTSFYYGGSHTVAVINPPSVQSNLVSFTVANPLPALTSIAPTTVIAGGLSFPLTVRGSNFSRQSTILYAGRGLGTTFDSPTQLRTTVPGDWITSPGTASVTVTSPAPGGGVSQAIDLAIASPIPSLTSMWPTSALVGSTVTLTLDGSSFLSGAVVRWNDTPLATTYQSRTRLFAALPADQLALAGTAQVIVVNPDPYPASSNPATFTIQNPVPTISGAAPSAATAGTGNMAVTVNGAGFMSGAQISLSGVALATTWVSATRLATTLPAALLTAGYKTLTVANPAPNAGSAQLSYTVFNPVPVLDRVVPETIPEGTPGGLWITLEGSNFLSPYLQGVLHARVPMNLVSSTRLLIFLSPAQIASAVDYDMGLRNALPCPGHSQTVTFHVLPATCSDGVLNGTETGVDCGGDTCAGCYQGCSVTDPTCSEVNVGLASMGARVTATDSASEDLLASVNDGVSGAGATAWGNHSLPGSRLMVSFPRPYPIYQLSAAWGGSNLGWSADDLPAELEVQYTSDATALVTDPATSSKWSSFAFPASHLASSAGTVSGGQILPAFTSASWGTTQTISFDRVQALAVRLLFAGSPANVGGTDAVGLLSELGVSAVVFAQGATCTSGADCASGVCTNGACGAPVCADGVKNGTESDVDCGGTCHACSAGHTCNGASDCDTGICTGGVCVAPSCFDGQRNGTETDVDCGSICALRCDDYQRCAANVDCTSRICSGGICQVPTAAITQLTPSSAEAGAADLVMTLTGSMFRRTTSARFGTTSLATTYVSETELTAIVPAALLTDLGYYDVRVVTPGAAAPSSPLTFTVLPSCDGTSTSAVCGLTCTDLMSDPANCGACGNTCEGATSMCSFGACVTLPASSLRAWYRSDVGLLRDGSDKVTRWVDQSGHGFDLVPNNGAGPDYVAGATPSRMPSVRFTAASGTMLRAENRIALVNGAGEYTVFVAVKPGTSQQTYADILDYDHRSCQNFVIQQDYTNTNAFGSCGATRVLQASSFQVFSASYDLVSASASTCVTSADGVATGPSPMGCTFGWAEPGLFSVGGNLNYGRYFNGEVVEIIVYNRALTEAERTYVEAYLTTKLAGTCGLGSECPSGVCASGLCAAPACTDGVRNGAETDLDCGGNCAPCPTGELCRVDGDCVTGYCASGTCRIPDASLSALSPSSAVVGAPDLALTLSGTRFMPDAVVTFAGTELAASHLSSTTLGVTVPASLLAAFGSRTVGVTNPGTTAVSTRTFTINNPVPAIASFTPTSISAGSAAFTLTLTGSAFASGAVVSFNGSALATSFVSSTQLQAAVPANLVAVGGYYSVVVANPAPSLGSSAAVSYPVDNVTPVISSLSPATVPERAAQFTLTVNGAGFGVGAQVTFGGIAAATTFVSGTRLTAVVPASAVTVAGTAGVLASNVAPHPTTSLPAAFTISSATCADGVRNGTETDADCGGSCGTCTSGRGCATWSDCQSFVCTGGVCQAPSCSDRVRNGTETDVDCGSTCPACGVGGVCRGGFDCQTGACAGGVCQAATCSDGLMNGDETGVDCGGATCGPCPFQCTGSGCQSCLAILESGASMGSGVYVIDPDGSGPIAPFATYCDMTTDGGGWALAGKLSAAAMGPTATDPRTALFSGDLNVGDTLLMNRGNQLRHYSTPLMTTAWSSFTEARFELVDGAGAPGAALTFDTRGVTAAQSMARSRLKSSTWTDLWEETQNFFSSDGDATNGRIFFVHRNYGTCATDAGWMVITKGGTACPWDAATPYGIRYARGTTYRNMNDTANYVNASALAVWVRERAPNTSRASCLEILEAGEAHGDGVYTVDPGRDGSRISVLCDMTTASGGWTLAYKHSAGTPIPSAAADVIGVNYSSGSLNETDATLLDRRRGARDYSNRYLNRYWGRFAEARVEVDVAGAPVHAMRYNLTGGSGPVSFFTRSRLVESTWIDLVPEAQNYWSPRGDESNRRHWFVNRNYNGCASDAGWLVVNNSTGCSWEGSRPNSILYANATTYQNWTSGAVAQADALTVWVRERTPANAVLAPASCAAWRTAGSTESGLYDIDPNRTGSSVRVYCDMSTDGGGWALAWKHSAGVNRDPGWDLLTGGMNATDTSLMTRGLSASDFVSTITNTLRFSAFTEARFEVVQAGLVRQYVVHNAVGQTAKTVMAKSTLLRTSWSDLVSATPNYYSVDGDGSRNFFINRSYAGCPTDTGWLVALQGTGNGCSWEAAASNQILYANAATSQNWTSGSIARADAIVLWLR